MKPAEPLSDHLIEQILSALPRLRIGVLGDLFLDRYLDIDTTLNEPSIETGLDAYQVVQVRSYPGAAGTVINNLAALGVGKIYPISVIGMDGEGFELTEALSRLRGVTCSMVFPGSEQRTPTYTKPMLRTPGQPARELNRLDIKNRRPLPAGLEKRVLAALDETWPKLDALLVLDQVSEAECGVVTTGVRTHLAALALTNPDKLILADSRERIHLFRDMTVKVNGGECERALWARGIVTEMRSPGLSPVRLMGPEAMVKEFAAHCTRPVFCTWGDAGMHLASSANSKPSFVQVPAYTVAGPIDTVGAGDSTSAGIACALAAGTSLEQAAAFGNLIASITIQQIGTTGTASPEQVRQRWREVRDRKQ